MTTENEALRVPSKADIVRLAHLSPFSFETRSQAIVKIGLQQASHLLRPPNRHSDIRSAAVLHDPSANVLFATTEAELLPVLPDVLRESAQGTSCSVMLTRKARRMARLPDSEPLFSPEEQVDCLLSCCQRLWPRVRSFTELKLDILPMGHLTNSRYSPEAEQDCVQLF